MTSTTGTIELPIDMSEAISSLLRKIHNRRVDTTKVPALPFYNTPSTEIGVAREPSQATMGKAEEESIRAAAENYARTLKLHTLLQQRENGSISETDFSTELSQELWFKIGTETGTTDDLEFLRKLKSSPFCTSETLQSLLDRAEREIRKRNDSPAEVSEGVETAYPLPTKASTFPMWMKTLTLTIVEVITITAIVGGGIFGADLVWTQLAVLTGLGAGVILIFLGIQKSDDPVRRIFLHVSGAAMLFETSVVLWMALVRLPR
jgi:hypothetical protein